jgi:anaerobic magnesium-protoporphyrin IX monomethyl ester cyclase
MKVLMLNPPFLPKYSRFSRSPAVTKSGTIYFPIWHAYATGVLEQHGHNVKLVDAPADGLERDRCYTIAQEFHPEMVVLYTSTPSIYNDIEIGDELKSLLPDAYVVLTGPHVSALPEESLNLSKKIDAVARHEYDMTLVELSSAVHDKERLKEVRGITYRDGDSFISTPEREFIENLDTLPFVSAVYKKHLTIENYFYAHCRYPLVSIFTSRGCNARCTFCVYPQQMFGRRQRQRSPENIVEEFIYIQKELPQVKEVLIDDDTFSFHQDHTVRFCELMIEKNVNIPWTVECRATLKYDTMVMMKKAGCRLIVIGFESADDGILKNIKKGINLKQMKQFVEDAKRAGIMVHSCFMAGNMGETKETLLKSLAFAKEINADTCQFFPLMVYPGTEAYEWAKQNGYLMTNNYRNWLTEDGLHNCVVSTPTLKARDLVDFCDSARRQYYLGFKYLSYKLKQVMRDGEEMKKTLKSARTFAKYLFKKSG